MTMGYVLLIVVPLLVVFGVALAMAMMNDYKQSMEEAEKEWERNWWRQNRGFVKRWLGDDR